MSTTSEKIFGGIINEARQFPIPSFHRSRATLSSMELRTLTSNLRVGKAERRWENGREYLVAPITSIVPGVLPGSDGPGLYLPGDIQASTQNWNKLPLTAYHPMKLDGSPTSASSNGVKERQWIGEVRDSAFNNKLVHKGWFDAQLTKAIEPRIYNNLIQGIPIETSTGLYMEKDKKPGVWKGKNYDWVARNFRPDHLAVLPDQIGACSTNDGCGVLVNQQRVQLVINRLATQPLPTLESVLNANPEGHNQYTGTYKVHWQKAEAVKLAATKAGVKHGTLRIGTNAGAKVHTVRLSGPEAAVKGVAKANGLVHTSNSYVTNPFVSRAQQGACFAKKARGEAEGWDCKEWADKTDFKGLPERKVENVRPSLSMLLNSNPEGHNQYTAGGGFHVHSPGVLRARAGIHEYRIGYDTKSNQHHVQTARVTPSGKMDRPQPLGKFTDLESAKNAVVSHAHSKGRELVGNSNPEGHNQYTGETSDAGDDAHYASKAANTSGGTAFTAKTIDRIYSRNSHNEANMTPTLEALLNGHDRRVQNALGDQPRHPAEGTYQGKTHVAAKKGFNEASNILEAPGRIGAPVPSSLTAGEPIEDEDDEIGQGDRPQQKRSKDDDRGPSNVETTENAADQARDERGRFAATATEHANSVSAKTKKGDSPWNAYAAHKAAADAHTAAMNYHQANGPAPNQVLADKHSRAAREHEEAAQQHAQNIRPSKVVFNAINTKHCPECGGEMKDGECQECGYEEDEDEDDEEEGTRNEWSDAARYATNAKPSLEEEEEEEGTDLDDDNEEGESEEHRRKVLGRNCAMNGSPMNPVDSPTNPHGASVEAAGHSLELPAARDHAIAALDHSKAQNTEEAARAHKKSATAHENAATKARMEEDFTGADSHDKAAALHRRAASMHRASVADPAQNANPEGHNQYTSGAAQAKSKAASDASNNVPGARAGKSHTDASDTAKKFGTKAFSAEEHSKAVGFHRAASEAHFGAAQGAKSTRVKEAHATAARAHDEAADYHLGAARAKATTNRSTNLKLTPEHREKVINFLVTNCDCSKNGGAEGAKVLLNKKPDQELLRMKGQLLGSIVTNAKAEGSFADTKGDPKVKAQMKKKATEEDEHTAPELDDDLDADDDDEEVATGGFTGNATTQMDYKQFMAVAPPEIQEVVRESRRVTNRERKTVANRIIAAANSDPDPRRKQFILNKLKANPNIGLERLRELEMLVGRPIQNHYQPQQVVANSGNGLDDLLTENEALFVGTADGPSLTGNASDKDDILEPVTINWKEDPSKVKQSA